MCLHASQLFVTEWETKWLRILKGSCVVAWKLVNCIGHHKTDGVRERGVFNQLDKVFAMMFWCLCCVSRMGRGEKMPCLILLLQNRPYNHRDDDQQLRRGESEEPARNRSKRVAPSPTAELPSPQNLTCLRTARNPARVATNSTLSTSLLLLPLYLFTANTIIMTSYYDHADDDHHDELCWCCSTDTLHLHVHSCNAALAGARSKSQLSLLSCGHGERNEPSLWDDEKASIKQKSTNRDDLPAAQKILHNKSSFSLKKIINKDEKSFWTLPLHLSSSISEADSEWRLWASKEGRPANPIAQQHVHTNFGRGPLYHLP